MESIVKHFRVGEKRFKIYIYIDENKEHWFNSNDVARALGSTTPETHILEGVAERYKLISWDSLLQNNKPSDKILINEPGIYQLLMTANLPNSNQFQAWIYSYFSKFNKTPQTKLINDCVFEF